MVLLCVDHLLLEDYLRPLQRFFSYGGQNLELLLTGDQGKIISITICVLFSRCMSWMSTLEYVVGFHNKSRVQVN